jgi:glycerol-3-phosphate dehydrogenase (NAD(P)+)
MKRAAVLGAGSWGTTLAILLVRRGLQVTLWGRDSVQVRRMRSQRQNERYLPGVTLPSELGLMDQLSEALPGRELVVFAVPSTALPTVARQAAPWVAGNATVVSAIKGLETEQFRRMTEILEDELSPGLAGRVASLSGPSLAREVARGSPTATVAAAREERVAEEVRDLFHGDSFRVYSNTDVVGVEIGVAVKNVVAIAAGMSDGLGFGDNARGALLTRGLSEMTRLAVHLGARAETLFGLAGIGDLITTCSSRLSRNRHVGEELGRGRPLQRILDDMVMVAEGVPTTRAVYQLSRQRGLEMPIAEQVHAVLFEQRDPREVLSELMSRQPKSEVG